MPPNDTHETKLLACEVRVIQLLHRLQDILRFTEIQVRQFATPLSNVMNRASSHFIVLGLFAAAISVTAGAVQAAETVDRGLISYTTAVLQRAAEYWAQAQNVALATNGAVASASSSGFGDDGPSSASKLIDDVRSGTSSYGTDDTVDEFPAAVQINFFGEKMIDRVVVYSVQDSYFDGVDPTDSDPCYIYGLVDFTVTLATVSDNVLCKRTLTFAPFATDQIRINVTVTGGWSLTRIAEIEAWEAR